MNEPESTVREDGGVNCAGAGTCNDVGLTAPAASGARQRAVQTYTQLRVVEIAATAADLDQADLVSGAEQQESGMFLKLNAVAINLVDSAIHLSSYHRLNTGHLLGKRIPLRLSSNPMAQTEQRCCDNLKGDLAAPIMHARTRHLPCM
jgi:hypothetical protein